MLGKRGETTAVRIVNNLVFIRCACFQSLPYYEKLAEELKTTGVYVAFIFSNLTADEANAYEMAAIDVVKRRTFFLLFAFCLYALKQGLFLSAK